MVCGCFSHLSHPPPSHIYEMGLRTYSVHRMVLYQFKKSPPPWTLLARSIAKVIYNDYHSPSLFSRSVLRYIILLFLVLSYTLSFFWHLFLVVRDLLYTCLLVLNFLTTAQYTEKQVNTHSLRHSLKPRHISHSIHSSPTNLSHLSNRASLVYILSPR